MTLTLSEEGRKFLEGNKITGNSWKSTARSLPYPIYLTDVVAEAERREKLRLNARKRPKRRKPRPKDVTPDDETIVDVNSGGESPKTDQ